MCNGGHHSYLADATDPHAEGGGFTGSGTYSAAALAAATTPSLAASKAEHTVYHKQGSGMLSPGRRRRGVGRDDSGFVRGDHYCRIRVGRKGGPSELVEVRREEEGEGRGEEGRGEGFWYT